MRLLLLLDMETVDISENVCEKKSLEKRLHSEGDKTASSSSPSSNSLPPLQLSIPEIPL